MNCKKTQDNILSMINGELKEKESELFKNHIGSCVNCGREYELTLKLNKIFSSVEELELSPDFDRRFWQKFESERAREREKMGLKDLIFDFLFKPKMVPVYVSAMLLIIVVAFLPGYFSKNKNIEMQLAANYELLDNFELIENFELVSNLDIITNLSELEEE